MFKKIKIKKNLNRLKICLKMKFFVHFPWMQWKFMVYCDFYWHISYVEIVDFCEGEGHVNSFIENEWYFVKTENLENKDENIRLCLAIVTC